ncbi:hypothetical protein CRYUN_Cryun19dG0083000 [Craigia yunnanensis]
MGFNTQINRRQLHPGQGPIQHELVAKWRDVNRDSAHSTVSQSRKQPKRKSQIFWIYPQNSTATCLTPIGKRQPLPFPSSLLSNVRSIQTHTLSYYSLLASHFCHYEKEWWGLFFPRNILDKGRPCELFELDYCYWFFDRYKLIGSLCVDKMGKCKGCGKLGRMLPRDGPVNAYHSAFLCSPVVSVWDCIVRKMRYSYRPEWVYS